MEKFKWDLRTKVYFGNDSIESLKAEVKDKYEKILLVIGSGSVERSGLLNEVTKALEEVKIEYVVLRGVRGNPRISKVYEGIEIGKKENIDFVLALGGGSVLDTGKAIAGGLKTNRDIWEAFTGEYYINEAIPFGDILTVAATGSEMNGFCVITNDKTMDKRGTFSEEIKPAFSILNPEYTLELPKGPTMSGVSDAMAHVFEQYFSKSKNVLLQHEIGEGVLRSLIYSGELLRDDLKNYEGRETLMWAATLALNGTVGQGKIGDWACHSMSNPISGKYDIPHGVALSILFPNWMEIVFKEDVDLFKRMFEKVFGVMNIYDGISRLKSFYYSLGLPKSFRDLGIPKSDIIQFVDYLEEIGPIGNFKRLTREEIFKIYELSFK